MTNHLRNLSSFVTPLSLNQHSFVTEYKPFLHRATPAEAGLALDPTNPKSTNVASETLRIRHEGFSPSNATHTGILTSIHSTLPYRICFAANRTLTYHNRAL